MDISSNKKTQISYHSKNATILTDLNKEFSNVSLNTDVVTMTNNNSNNYSHRDNHTHSDNTQLQKKKEKPLQKAYNDLQWLTGC